MLWVYGLGLRVQGLGFEGSRVPQSPKPEKSYVPHMGGSLTRGWGSLLRFFL